MKKVLFIMIFAISLISCTKISTNDKINIHITNNRSSDIHVEFRAGSTVCSNGYVSGNSTNTDEAFKGEYDVYVANFNPATNLDGPMSYQSHGLFYSDDNYVVVN